MKNNLEEYNFSDFTLKNYRKLIRMAKKNFLFKGFDEINFHEKFILWRHDLDFSPQIAVKTALIEFEEGVKATYFVNLHSEFFHFWEKPVFKCLKKISELGHDIGLHFDCHFYENEINTKFEKLLSKERDFLQIELGVKINSFSFHNPSRKILEMDDIKYSGMINAYSSSLMNKIDYCSDSNGYWRFERLEEVIKKNERSLQVLTHDAWWQDDVMPPRRRIMRIIDQRAEYYRNLYDDFLKKCGRENIDWD